MICYFPMSGNGTCSRRNEMTTWRSNAGTCVWEGNARKQEAKK